MDSSFSPIDHPSAWRASERDKDSFTVELSAQHLEALDQALQAVKRKTTDTESITRDDFQLQAIEDDVTAWRNQVMELSGIVILRGFPVEIYSKEDLGMIYFGLGAHFGIAMSQSVMGDRPG